MLKRISLGLAALGATLALSFAAAAPASAEPVAPAGEPSVTADDVSASYACKARWSEDTNIRRNPNTNQAPIGTLASGKWIDAACEPVDGATKTTCGEKTEWWIKVKRDGVVGYIHSGCLKDYQYD